MNLEEARQKMDKTIDLLQRQLIGVRSSQVSISLVGSFKVKHFGRDTQIDHIAVVSPNKTNVSVQIYDPSILADRGILNRIVDTLKNSGLNAYMFSKDTVCVSVEKYGQKDRVVAHIKKSVEEAKIAVRNIRKTVRNKNKASIKEIDKKLQKLTDDTIKEIERYAQAKIKGL